MISDSFIRFLFLSKRKLNFPQQIRHRTLSSQGEKKTNNPWTQQYKNYQQGSQNPVHQTKNH